MRILTIIFWRNDIQGQVGNGGTLLRREGRGGGVQGREACVGGCHKLLREWNVAEREGVEGHGRVEGVNAAVAMRRRTERRDKIKKE